MQSIKLMIIDVDGTLTDGGIYYDNFGNELKKFCTRDAAGFFAASKCGIKIMVLTGRACQATQRRMKELNVDYVEQGVKDKFAFINEFLNKNKINYSEVGYIGDDLNDLYLMHVIGYKACPNDSCREIKEVCDYISPINGGSGAVRDIIEHYLRKNGLWNDAINQIYLAGI
ncbi:KdsC family phosphatase [Succinivibrio dextrinosolvens]|uniref:3-deoxy-D-manno-octulosonate 8-phosphate phosphatase KdsC n=1 Tax=Succinivibrio dextrinosolvens TaxID=83771 RepID=A0A662ZDQ8_9GAMM|nr:HAD hydrolase family protein [Succinivibrio dextrinosolvens]SFK44994.1 3-deoxy-D-manno-octulosonate 8-phosphate phosphatase (KDO 8-P phosphatase) [Succinivibrio dextrinosolvens]